MNQAARVARVRKANAIDDLCDSLNKILCAIEDELKATADEIAKEGGDASALAYLASIARGNQAQWSGGMTNSTNIVERLTQDAALVLTRTFTNRIERHP